MMTTVRKKLGESQVSLEEIDELRAMRDEDIDFSDIPELTEADFRNAVVRPPAGQSTDEVELYRDNKGNWRWRRRSANGVIVGASSQGYKQRRDALENALRLASPFRISEATDS